MSKTKITSLFHFNFIKIAGTSTNGARFKIPGYAIQLRHILFKYKDIVGNNFHLIFNMWSYLQTSW